MAMEYLHSEDQLRFMARVARMYHERGLRQAVIAKELGISQARVSRLLKRAVDVGIVRTTVTPPAGVYLDLEEQLEAAYGLDQAVIVDPADDGQEVTRALGAAAADYLTATLIGGEQVGISSWSASLLAAMEALRPFRTTVVDSVVQLIGGIGNPRVQMQATRLIGLFAGQTGAEPMLLPTPGVLGSADARRSLMTDPAVRDVVRAWDNLTVALVGIGGVEPSDLARQSGNTFSEHDRTILKRSGAVGDICFRFYDLRGRPVESEINDRVMGITSQQLLAVPRRIAVAGGERKRTAVRGALLGGWVNVLVTDADTARSLLPRP